MAPSEKRRNVSIIRLAFFSPTYFSRSNGSSPRPVLPRRRHKVDVVSSYISPVSLSAKLKSFSHTSTKRELTLVFSFSPFNRKIPLTLTSGRLYLQRSSAPKTETRKQNKFHQNGFNRRWVNNLVVKRSDFQPQDV